MADIVRCVACHRPLGTATGQRPGITCVRPACSMDFPKPSRFEDRDAIIDSLERAIVPLAQIADAVGVSTSRIGQILAQRRRTS